MSDLKNLPNDLEKELKDIANNENALILSFIAPDEVVPISPTSYSYAHIEPRDMYCLEKTIEELNDKGELPKNLHLIIQTPGGALSTSFKISMYLRGKFENIQAFVPYEAASGGTLMCTGANKITLGELGNLTPIDTQVSYNGRRVSSYRIIEAVREFEKKFGKTNPVDIPPPWQQMADKFDPLMYSEMETSVYESLFYASRLLRKSGYQKEDAFAIAAQLARTPYTHEHCINIEEAEEIGLHLANEKKDQGLLRTYKKWVEERLKAKVAYHIIEHYSPKKTKVPEQKVAVQLENAIIKKKTTKESIHE